MDFSLLETEQIDKIFSQKSIGLFKDDDTKKGCMTNCTTYSGNNYLCAYII